MLNFDYRHCDSTNLEVLTAKKIRTYHLTRFNDYIRLLLF